MTQASIFTYRKIVFPLLLLAVLWLAFSWWRHNSAISYKTAVVEKGDVEATVAAIGTLSPRLSVEIGAQVSGQIITLAVEPGSVVQKGQLLVEIDASLQQASVDALRAQLAAQQAQLASREAKMVLARQKYLRQQRLIKTDATRDEDVETATANWKVAVASVTELKAQMKETSSRLKGDEAQLGYTRIYAPVAGTVLAVEAKQGQTLNATYSTPVILTIADLTTMTVEAKVAEADISFIKPGMSVWFNTLGNNTRRWRGQVSQVLPAPLLNELNPGIVFYRVLFEVGNDDGALMSGMTVQVSFLIESANGVLLVPMNALMAVEGAAGKNVSQLYTVRVLDVDAQVQERRVEIGRKDLFSAEVLKGLQQGDEVVIGEVGPTLKRGG